MDGDFALRLAVSFVVGGASVALFTAIAERQGSRLGGLLLSFPIKIVVTLALIAANEGLVFAAATASAVPAGIAINVVFLATAALLASRMRPAAAIAAGMLAWGASALALVASRPPGGLWTYTLLWVAAVVVASVLLDRVPNVRGDRRAARPTGGFGARGMLARASGAGTVVAASVLLARIAGPFIGGLASVFPSGFLTTLVILLHRQGPEFTAATARVMVLGSAAPLIFGVVAALALPRTGLLFGLSAALATATCASVAIGWALQRVDVRGLPAAR